MEKAERLTAKHVMKVLEFARRKAAFGKITVSIEHGTVVMIEPAFKVREELDLLKLFNNS